jgi:ABC-2 type transport system permease protein
VIRAVWHGYATGWRMFRAYPDSLFPLFMTPFLSVIFLMIIDHAGREDLTSYAVVAPVFIALWWVSLLASGGVISWDRWQGTLELAIAAPTSFALVVFGRILAVTTTGLVGFVEVWVIAKLLYRAEFTIHHPFVFAATLAVSAAAMAATAFLMSTMFVLARNAITFVNSGSYPFFLLGGVLVPASYLPGWLQPLSTVVFLSWSSDLLRAALAPGPIEDIAFRLAMVLALGFAALALGAFLMTRVLRRVRYTGDLAYQ